jgi:hypothetical protein
MLIFEVKFVYYPRSIHILLFLLYLLVDDETFEIISLRVSTL